MDAHNRYRRDPWFRKLVEYLEDFLAEGQATPTILTEAILLAQWHLDRRRPAPILPCLRELAQKTRALTLPTTSKKGDEETMRERALTKDAVIAILTACAALDDKDQAHCQADHALLDYIHDREIEAAYDAIERWFA